MLVRYPVNFKLATVKFLPLVSSSQLGNVLTYTFASLSDLNDYVNHLTALTERPEVCLVRREGSLVTESYPLLSFGFDTALLTVGIIMQNATFETLTYNLADCSSSMNGETPKLPVYSFFTASVDEMTNGRVASTSLEDRPIDVEGRWIGKPPKLQSGDRHRIIMNVDGNTWVPGTFKHVPRLRSRLENEKFFGSPLLGVVSLNDLSTLPSSPLGDIWPELYN